MQINIDRSISVPAAVGLGVFLAMSLILFLWSGIRAHQEQTAFFRDCRALMQQWNATGAAMAAGLGGLFGTQSPPPPGNQTATTPNPYGP